MTHLGPLVSALADGQLSPARAERAFEHVAACPGCKRALDAERASRAAARAAAVRSAEVRASPELQARLLALQIPGQSPSLARPMRTRILTGTVASVGLFALTLFVLGGQQRQVQDPSSLLAAGSLTPDAGHVASVVDEVATPRDARLSAALLEWMGTTGWAAPDALPAGMSVADLQLHTNEGAEVLEVRLDAPAGAVTVLEQHGQLDSAVLAPLVPTLVGDHEVYLVSGDWWLIQCGDSVVAVSSGADPAAAHEVIRAIPSADDTIGVVDRLADGWTVLLAGF